MSNLGWKYLKINDCAEVVGGGTPSTKHEEYWGGDISWIAPKDLSNNSSKYIFKGKRNITKKGLENSSAKILPINSLLFSSRAPIGYLAINKKPIATNQGFKSLILKKGFDVEFFYYLLKDRTEYIKSFASGSTFQEVSGSVVKNLSFLIPDIKEQKNISNILSKIDQKIEINQKINETLDDILKTLFKSWFVDFNTVKDKADGKSTGLTKDISDLFADSLKESKLGKIPKDYSLDKLGDHIEITKGKSYKSNELHNSKVALVTLKSFLRNGGYREDGLKEYIGEFKEEQVVKEGDLIVAFTDVTQSADVIGKPAIIIDNPKYSKLVISLDVGVVRTKKNSPISKNFIYYLMLTNRYASNSLAYTNGTNVLHLNKKAITDFIFCLPSKKLLEKFNKISEKILKKKSINSHENKILHNLRNIILPKLISGDLKI